MSEYTEVEQPFLHQLAALGWAIIDQGAEIPSDPGKSLRHSRQWLLPELFAKAVAGHQNYCGRQDVVHRMSFTRPE